MLFKNEYEFLSNFYKSPMIINDLYYPTVEHYFQSLKCLDVYESEKIRLCNSPSIAKKLGRSSTLKSNWENIKYSVMMTGCVYKFKDKSLRQMLDNIHSDIEIVEDNYWHDNFWGNCLCPKCINKKGYNNLGKILTHIKHFN